MLTRVPVFFFSFPRGDAWYWSFPLSRRVFYLREARIQSNFISKCSDQRTCLLILVIRVIKTPVIFGLTNCLEWILGILDSKQVTTIKPKQGTNEYKENNRKSHHRLFWCSAQQASHKALKKPVWSSRSRWTPSISLGRPRKLNSTG